MENFEFKGFVNIVSLSLPRKFFRFESIDVDAIPYIKNNIGDFILDKNSWRNETYMFDHKRFIEVPRSKLVDNPFYILSIEDTLGLQLLHGENTVFLSMFDDLINDDSYSYVNKELTFLESLRKITNPVILIDSKDIADFKKFCNGITGVEYAENSILIKYTNIPIEVYGFLDEVASNRKIIIIGDDTGVMFEKSFYKPFNSIDKKSGIVTVGFTANIGISLYSDLNVAVFDLDTENK